jgi:type IV secretory pathway VirB10-like protein
VVPPAAFDVSPASTVVTAKMKIGAALSTAIGKVVLGAAVVGSVGGGAAAVVRVAGERQAVIEPQEGVVRAKAERRAPAPSEPEPTKLEPAPAAVPAPVPVPQVVAVEPPEPEPQPTRASKRRNKRTNAGTSTFGDEFSLIRKAQRELASGHADAALATLREHERRFPKGSMNEDRLALRALALCSAGRRDEGRRAAKRLERRFPRSVYAERVNEACH